MKNNVYRVLLLMGLAFQSSLATAQNFESTKPAARVEHWQKRQSEISTYLQQSKDLGAVKLLFVGDSITDFWLFDDNPWVSGQKFGINLLLPQVPKTSPSTLAFLATGLNMCFIAYCPSHKVDWAI
jgi:hypothetical protein